MRPLFKHRLASEIPSIQISYHHSSIYFSSPARSSFSLQIKGANSKPLNTRKGKQKDENQKLRQFQKRKQKQKQKCKQQKNEKKTKTKTKNTLAPKTTQNTSLPPPRQQAKNLTSRQHTPHPPLHPLHKRLKRTRILDRALCIRRRIPSINPRLLTTGKPEPLTIIILISATFEIRERDRVLGRRPGFAQRERDVVG